MKKFFVPQPSFVMPEFNTTQSQGVAKRKAKAFEKTVSKQSLTTQSATSSKNGRIGRPALDADVYIEQSLAKINQEKLALKAEQDKLTVPQRKARRNKILALQHRCNQAIAKRDAEKTKESGLNRIKQMFQVVSAEMDVNGR